jgi:RNA polymerase sigma factor (sigma-70 family)
MGWISADIDQLLARRDGNEIARAIKDPVYGLAIRMLGDPADAADATQEILLRVVAHLGQFRGDSSASTWVYRVAANFLLTARARRAEAKVEAGTFDEAADQLAGALQLATEPASDDRALVEEVKLWCTHGMLLHLDRPHRIAYILGEILELASEEGAEILEISSDAFRKRLSRARGKVEEFVRAHCGLVEKRASCRCAKLVAPAIQLGIVNPERLKYASRDRAEQLRRDIDEFRNAAALLRSQPTYTLAMREMLGHKFEGVEV